MADAEVGDVLAGYRLDAVLGEGGMGRVFRAVRESDGSVVALKLVRGELSSDEQHQRRFRREARAAAAVRHPNLVAVIDAGQEGALRYLAMEHIEGESLADRIAATGPLPIDEAVRMTGEVAEALDALHAAGILHRDVKPSNVMVDADGRARLTDFGLARGRDLSVVTVPGQLVGSIDYLAPEVLRGAEPDAAADVYALGCLAYEALCGRPPFVGTTFQVGMGHLGEPVPDPREHRPETAAELAAAVLPALAKEPGDRPLPPTAYGRALALAAAAG